MRKVALILMSACLLTGCTQQSVSTTEGVATPSIAKEDIYRIQIGDKELTVPFSVSELSKAGLTLSEMTVEQVTRGADNIAYYTDTMGGTIVVNLGSYEPKCSPEDAYVIDILSDKGNTDSSSLLVFGGIGFDSTKEEVEAVFGEPVFEDNGMTMYSKVDSDAYMDGVYVAMDGDEVIRVETLSTKDFVDLEESETESE